MISKTLESRALAAYFRTADNGADQPTNEPEVDEIDGLQYVTLHNTNGILAVYRVTNRGDLKRLRRYPLKLDALYGDTRMLTWFDLVGKTMIGTELIDGGSDEPCVLVGVVHAGIARSVVAIPETLDDSIDDTELVALMAHEGDYGGIYPTTREGHDRGEVFYAAR